MASDRPNFKGRSPNLNDGPMELLKASLIENVTRRLEPVGLSGLVGSPFFHCSLA